jgi:redox-sensitive bicupin YhaK (pirin superfamily)
MRAETTAMIQLRPARERGHSNLGWLDSSFTFSFARYHDPRHMGFRSLRVINEDHIAPGGGFGTHPHSDMEIVTYVLEGALEHRDSLGTGSVIRPGDVQRMTAGTGVTHSEYNHSRMEPVHLLQIWIEPEQEGLEPGYEQKNFAATDRKNRLRVIASRSGRDGSLTVHQDAELLSTLLDAGKKVSHELQPGRHAWVQVVKGAVTLNGEKLETGDGAAASDENRLEIEASAPSELLLFDLA